jgi:hypothetical protein
MELLVDFCNFADMTYLMGKSIMKPTEMQSVFLNVPREDWKLLQELIQKYGWQAETREQLLERFVQSRPETPYVSEDEIVEEVKAIRHKS